MKKADVVEKTVLRDDLIIRQLETGVNFVSIVDIKTIKIIGAFITVFRMVD